MHAEPSSTYSAGASGAVLALGAVVIAALAGTTGVNLGLSLHRPAMNPEAITEHLSAEFGPDTPWLAEIEDIKVSPVIDLVTIWAPAEYAAEDAMTACQAVRGYLRDSRMLPTVTVLAGSNPVVRSAEGAPCAAVTS